MEGRFRDFYNNNHGYDDALFSKRIQEISTLEPDSYAYKAVAKSCEEVTRCLRTYPMLKEVELSRQIWSDHSDAIRFFRVLAESPNIVQMTLVHFGVTFGSDRVIYMPLLISKLSVRQCASVLMWHVMPLIAYPHNLVSLSVTDTDIDPEAFDVLLKALQTNETSLENLCFQYISLTADRFRCLMHALGTNTTIKTLQLFEKSECFVWPDVYKLFYKNHALVVVKIGDSAESWLRRSLRAAPLLKSKMMHCIKYHPTLEEFVVMYDIASSEDWVPAADNRIKHINNTRKATTFTSLLTRKCIKSRCFACSGMFKKLQQCSRCKRAYYCSKVCQVLHWREHKINCVPL